jgi:hypothetical protein
MPTPVASHADGDYPWSIRAHIASTAEDPDVLKAIKAFRPRT